MQTHLTLTIEVTWEDIASGCDRDYNIWTCPVARAVNRAFDALGFTGAAETVYSRSIYRTSDDWWVWEHPEEVTRWILRYDGQRFQQALPFNLRARFERRPLEKRNTLRTRMASLIGIREKPASPQYEGVHAN